MTRHKNSIPLYNGQIFVVWFPDTPKDEVLRDYKFIVRMCNTGI